ncbi:MAG TPA: BTAD domain-containing putative transcriptional regulator, partial [Jiangellales bacterium]|nr:BTAD domain-containing putative transcriptional regulator [Jiangellales bacterium]
MGAGIGAGVRVRVLGPATVEGGPPLSGRDRRVLAALVVEADRVVSADRLAAALYGGHPPATWRKVVQGIVGRLRRLLGMHAIATRPGGYQLELGDDEIDVRRFERLVGEAEELAAVGEHERAVLALDSALSLVSGEPFADLDGWDPGVAAAARCAELIRQAQERRLQAQLACGRYQEALAAATEMVVREPLREQRWAALALAQYRAGRQGEALRTTYQARRLLADELGLDPGPELVGLERSILAQDPSLAGSPRSDTWRGATCPYRGLATYDVDDGPWYFGRDRDIDQCLRIVDATGFLAIVGASGSGKSSLARAGIAPALRRPGREVAVIHPGARPDEVLNDVPRGAVLVVDQIEELFVLCHDPAARARFAAAIARWAAVAPVVVTLRADHLAAVTEVPELTQRVQAGIYLLGAMGEAQLRAAIQGPADKAGLRLEPGLIDLLIRDVAGQPGALPLLSHALAETFERREGPVLTAAGYAAVGGVHGAVARAADQVVDSLPPAGRKAAREVFLRLVIPTDAGEPMRQRVPRAALAVDPTIEQVLDALVQSRLVIADEETVEVAHEAVCRAWPRLRAWLDEDRDGLRIHQHLAQSAREWNHTARDPSELYRGARLVAATDWAAREDGVLNHLERAFLAASSARRHEEQHETRRRIRRLRAAVGGVGLLLVLALVAGLLAVQGDRNASRQRDAARAAQQDAQLQALVSQSLASRSSNRALAALLAVEAHRRRPDARSWSALLATFTGSPGFVGYQHVPAEHSVTGTLVPHTSSAVAALDGRQLALVNLNTGETEDRFPPPAQGTLNYSVVRVSANGRFVAHLADVEAARPANTLTVYEVATGRQVHAPLRLPFYAGDVAINHAGSLVAVAGGPTGELATYRVADGALIGRLAGLGQPKGVALTRDTAAVDFGPDGRVYLGSMRGPIRAVDPATLRVAATFQAPVLSSHNQLMATRSMVIAAGDEAAVAIDLSTGAARWSFQRATGGNACSVIAVALDSRKLYCRNLLGFQATANLGRAGRLEERNLETGLPTGVVLDPQQGTVGDIGVTADGRELVTFSHNAPVIARWRLDGTGPVTTRIARGRVGAAFDPTGRLLLVSHERETPRFQDERRSPDDWYVWDPIADRMVDPLDGIVNAAWGPPGELAVVFTGRAGGFYDLNTRSRMQGPPLTVDGPIANTFRSTDGRRLYVGFVDGRIRTLDTMTRAWVEPTIHLPGQIGSLSATGDGSRIVATTFHQGEWQMTVHDGITGSQIGEPVRNVNTAQVAPDGTLVSATYQGQITRHDPDTLRPVGSFPGVRGFIAASGGLRFSSDSKVLLATDGRNVS